MTASNVPDDRRRRALRFSLLAAAAGLAPDARSQAFPSKPVRMIIPASPGGGTDVLSRTLAKVISEQNGVPVPVENRAGASGSIGVQATVNAPADGYTIMSTLADATTIYPLLKKVPPYRAEKDLTPIAQIAQTQVLFAVATNSPYRTVQDFVEQTHKRKMAYGSNGFATVTHLWIEWFKKKTGAKLLHVPYKGAGPAVQALAAGEHDFVVASPASLKAQMDAGRVRPLVAGSATRLPGFPNVPTMVESGYPDFLISAWFGVFGPRNLPPAIADKLHEMVTSAMRTPEYQRHAATFMFETPFTSRADFTKLIADDAGLWRSAIEAAGIEPED